jgi:hypothetical protein
VTEQLHFELDHTHRKSEIQNAENLETTGMASLITRMMEAVQTSEMMVNSYQSTWQHNPEDGHIHTHHHENLKSYWLFLQ